MRAAMAQFFGLMPLNADNFESGDATAGQVLSADGSGGASWETPAGGEVQGVDVKSTVPAMAMMVSGAGSQEANGIYYLNGERNGYPQYTLENSTYDYAAIFYDSGLWLLAVEKYDVQMFIYYMSTSSAESPELVDGWDVSLSGSEQLPAPTVTAQEIEKPVEAGKALMTDGAGKASWESTGLPFKSYVVAIAQDGDDSLPYITGEIYNSLGITDVSFGYLGIGQYSMNIPQGFDHTKAIALFNPIKNAFPNLKIINFIIGEYGTSNGIEVRNSLAFDDYVDGLDDWRLEIRVYD